MAKWFETIDRNGLDPAEVADSMDRVNPVHIPRNHLVDEALARATEGDTSGFTELAAVLDRPFERNAAPELFAMPAPVEFTAGYRTFCGT